ncbi:MAG: GNAT family N-acetyltransferase [Bacteroidales bacterium]|jgi:ribosomal protein S18 acetylase RimI-like enzyme|nr:GNAT family N-acetyltransferase [Bacteroidales bacterium]MDY0086618.1 GNAT family N-acetyltransferase [Bacteroidales bacterium]
MKKPNTRPFLLRQLQFEEVQKLVSWAAAEGWNPGPHDALAFWQTDPEGFVGYFEQDELIAGGSIVSYDGLFGFMGFFIVKPEYRSKGIGRQLWMSRRDRLLARLKQGSAIGMDGVLAMQDFYRKGGFKLAFRDERYERKGETFNVHKNITSYSEKDFQKLQLLDAQCFGVPRTTFLLHWLQLPESRTFTFIQDQQLKGYVLLRKAGTGYKIGPLFAENYPVAEALYQACLDAVPNESVYLDIPVTNPDAVKLVKNFQAEYVFECGRMYYGKAPELPIQKIFGITTFELG